MLRESPWEDGDVHVSSLQLLLVPLSAFPLSDPSKRTTSLVLSAPGVQVLLFATLALL